MWAHTFLIEFGRLNVTRLETLAVDNKDSSEYWAQYMFRKTDEMFIPKPHNESISTLNGKYN